MPLNFQSNFNIWLDFCMIQLYFQQFIEAIDKIAYPETLTFGDYSEKCTKHGNNNLIALNLLLPNEKTYQILVTSGGNPYYR